jgi:hypothetical protein
MKTTLLLFAGLITGLAHAQTFEYLDINQVKARVNSGGDLHYDSTHTAATYECPKGSNKNWGGLASLWLGGLDIGGQLHIASQTYRQSASGGINFWPGPLDVITSSTNSTTVNQYNRVWKLNKTDIQDFITNYANGNVQNGSFIPAANLLSWPGNGDIAQNYDSQLAPYMDVNSDGIYDPMAGDYPLIKGDQAIYTIFNDAYQLHPNGGKIIGAEIRLMAYAYGPCSITTSNPFLNYTTFYNYKIINRSSFSLYDTYAELFTDIDMSVNPISPNDRAGCDVQNSYAYNYNSQFASNPAIGIVQLKGPINTADGIDNDNDGSFDEPFENMLMTNFMYFNNSLPGISMQTTDPGTSSEYYQYMTGFWRDGTPLTCGGTGYGGSTPTKFAYPDNTYANGPCGSTSWTETGTGSDKRLLIGSGPYILHPGAVDEIEFAYISSFDSITNNPLGKLDLDVQALKAIYNSTINQCSITGMKEKHLQTEFTISPNPTNALLNINSGKVINGDVKIEVIDALGKVLISEDYKDFNQSTIDVSPLSSGIYFLKISSGENVTTKKIIKE